jgi:parvulin-like peptidyl-prolyl isomerase
MVGLGRPAYDFGLDDFVGPTINRTLPVNGVTAMSRHEADLNTQSSSPGSVFPTAATRIPNKRWRRRVVALVGATTVVAVCIVVKLLGGRTAADAQAPAGNRAAKKSTATSSVRQASSQTPAQGGAGQPLQVMAIVNGEQISRQELAQECLSVFGKEVLESVLNKYLIVQYCEKRKIVVTQAEVDQEIDRMARKFSLTKDQYLKMLKQERGIKPEQYANDIVWPMLALRRLAKDQITPTEQEIERAMEAQYGEAVKARIIVLDNADEARRVHKLAAQNPDDFGALAKNHSKDPSASYNGLIQPIRRFVGHAGIEKAAFGLAEGQVSPVITVALGQGEQQTGLTQYVILKCEGRLPPMKVKQQLVEERLRESIIENKLRNVAAEIFKKVQDEAQVVNVYNDPARRAQMPGVAATINGHKILLNELAEECLARHGAEVLEGTISRLLLEQALKRRNLTVTRRDIDEEVARAALSMGQKTADGEPDVRKWLTTVQEEQGLSLETYFRDSVEPSVALKKLAGDVEVTNDDLQKGYEANYGPRVRCRAIVLANQRKAQEVWELARSNPDQTLAQRLETFGKLAEEHSIEASSKALQGKVPPIQRHGGQVHLEKEAFALKPGELSGIVQLGENFVILFCEGYTEPTKVSFNEVKQVIHNDIFEKKQRIAMAQVFNQLKDSAQIDNFLTGDTQSPNKRASHSTAVPQKGAPAGAKRNVAPANAARPGAKVTR